MAILKRLHSMIMGQRDTTLISITIGEDIFIGACLPSPRPLSLDDLERELQDTPEESNEEQQENHIDHIVNTSHPSERGYIRIINAPDPTPTHYIGHYDIRSTPFFIPDNKAMGYRKCWMCERQMNFRECAEANKTMKLDELMKSWKHKNVEIACCSCTDRLKSIVDNINYIHQINITKVQEQIYSVKKDILYEGKLKIKSVRIAFDNGHRIIVLSEQQFRALLDKHIIDVPIELEGVNHD